MPGERSSTSQRRRFIVGVLAALARPLASQRLYGYHQTFEQLVAPTYAGERCAYYTVRRLSWLAVRSVVRGEKMHENDARHWPRLGELLSRPASEPNASICDGYGVVRHKVEQQCTECPGDPFKRDEWSVLLCAPQTQVGCGSSKARGQGGEAG